MTLLREQHTEREVPGAVQRGSDDGVVQRGDTGHGQGLTLVHVSAQLEPFLTQNTL